VTINLFAQEDRSPSGTGRAQFQTHANKQRASDRNVQATNNTTVDPHEQAPPILTGSSGAWPLV